MRQMLDLHLYRGAPNFDLEAKLADVALAIPHQQDSARGGPTSPSVSIRGPSNRAHLSTWNIRNIGHQTRSYNRGQRVYKGAPPVV